MRGLTIIKRAFSAERIAGLLAAASAHAARVLRAHRDGEDLTLPPHWRWLQRAHACDLTALDPWTSEGRSENFSDTSLCAAVLTPSVRALVRQQIGRKAGSVLVRCRTIMPAQEDHRGLTSHKEITSIGFPGVHVIWTPLIAPGLRTNVDTPGIGFLHEGREIMPELEAGDIAFFGGEVEHWTHVPKSTVLPRVGCDIRLFPWTAENHLPEDAVAMGQKPLPLRWPSPLQRLKRG